MRHPQRKIAGLRKLRFPGLALGRIPHDRPNGILSLPRHDILDWNLQRVVNQIPTVFGRLVYVSSLRDPKSGRYSHNLLNDVLDGEEADRAICHVHHQVFSRWLAFGLREQKQDLDEYLNSVGITEAVLNYPELAPRNSREVEKLLYVTDLETVLELLRIERSADFLLRES